jgi:hypothetical protein
MTHNRSPWLSECVTHSDVYGLMLDMSSFVKYNNIYTQYNNNVIFNFGTLHNYNRPVCAWKSCVHVFFLFSVTNINNVFVPN